MPPLEAAGASTGEAYLTAGDGDRLLKIAEVTRRVSLSKSSIYAKVNDGTFPSPVRLGPAAVRWRKSEIDAWIAGLPHVFGGKRGG